MKRTPRDPDPGKRWLAILRNHREAIAAMDFFAVPTITLGLLYRLFPDKPWSPADFALQRHEASDKRVDCPAVAGGFSV
jgi:hypothetical protein